MAVALVPLIKPFLIIYLLSFIGACLDDRQECIKMVSTVWTACYADGLTNLPSPTTAESKLWIMQLMALPGVAQ